VLGDGDGIRNENMGEVGYESDLPLEQEQLPGYEK